MLLNSTLITRKTIQINVVINETPKDKIKQKLRIEGVHWWIFGDFSVNSCQNFHHFTFLVHCAAFSMETIIFY
jgi:hypothetical protein